MGIFDRIQALSCDHVINKFMCFNLPRTLIHLFKTRPTTICDHGRTWMLVVTSHMGWYYRELPQPPSMAVRPIYVWEINFVVAAHARIDMITAY